MNAFLVHAVFFFFFFFLKSYKHKGISIVFNKMIIQKCGNLSIFSLPVGKSTQLFMPL